MEWKGVVDAAFYCCCLPAARGVPPASQSTAVAVVTAASYAGTALAFGIAPTIIEQLGWPVRLCCCSFCLLLTVCMRA